MLRHDPKYSTPKHHNERLVSPPFEELAPTIESNRRLMEGYRYSIAGVSFREFRRTALEEILSASGDGPVVISAHQPGLPHMGVVEKLRLLEALSTNNFVSHIALDTDETEAVSAIIPLIVDGKRETEELFFYRSAVPRAIFTIPVPEKDALDSMCTEIARRLESTGSAAVTRAFERFSEIHNELYAADLDLGGLLSSYRTRYLRLEHIPERAMSSICRTNSWRIFVRSIADNIDDFSRIYNECLDRFREERKIKAPYSPFPNLLRSDEKIELPFWVSGEGGLRAGPFVLPGGELVNNAGESLDGALLLPRAITFTIFARLFLCDLFIHGTGGGNYDRATDTIIRAYFGVEPPAYCVTSATVYPELPMDREIELKIQRLKQELREMKQHPEKYVRPADPLMTEKMSIISKSGGTLDRSTHQRIKEINEELRRGIAGILSEAEKKLAELENVEKEERPWRRRDYPYFLF